MNQHNRQDVEYLVGVLLLTGAVASALMTSVIPAKAFGNHADWDCGNDVMVSTWKTDISNGDASERGARRFARAQ